MPIGRNRTRSESARAASRRNGAGSHGPKTEAGKQRSAANAKKHGLRDNSLIALQSLPAWLTEWQRELAKLAGSSPDARDLVDRAVLAELNLYHATCLLSEQLLLLVGEIWTTPLAAAPGGSPRQNWSSASLRRAASWQRPRDHDGIVSTPIGSVARP